MEKKKEEILAMENRILLEKQKLNAYLMQWDMADDLLLQEKVEDMQRSLDSLQKEFLLFKGRMEEKEAVNEGKEENHLAAAPSEKGGLDAGKYGIDIQKLEEPWGGHQEPGKGEIANSEKESGGLEKREPARMHVESTEPDIQKPADGKRDIEKTIGKSLMGVIASSFIFISIILFAVMLLPSMSDGFKIATMFLGSAIFTLAGMWNLKRERYHTFFLILSGCGIGAFYVSLLVTRFYFQAIDMIPFLALVLVWTVLVCILGRKKCQAFAWVGQSGNLISVIFCSGYLSCDGEYSLFFLLLGFYIAASMLYTLLYFDKTFIKNILNFGFSLAGVFAFLIAMQSLRTDLWEGMEDGIMAAEYHPAGVFCLQIVSVLLMLYLLVQIVLMYRTRSGENVIFFSVLKILELCALVMAAGCLADTMPSGGAWSAPVIFLLMLLALVAYEWRCRKERQGLRFFYEAASVFGMTLALLGMEILECHISIMPLVLGLLVAGYLLKNQLFLYLSLGELLVFRFVTLFEKDFPRMERAGWMLLYIGLCLILHHWIGNAHRLRIDKGLEEKKRRRSLEYRMVHSEEIHRLLVYVFFFFLFSNDIRYLIDMFAPYMDSFGRKELWNFFICIILGSVNLVISLYFQKKEYIEMPAIKRFGTLVCTAFQALCMIYAVDVLWMLEQEILHILMVLFAIALFSVNTRNLIRKYPGMLCGAYIGLKFTLLLYVILSSFDAPDVAVSIGCFLFAILCIGLGFIFHYRPIRIYGLVLSLISTVKLILVDLAYGNAGELALGFFICGILCFGISMIYHGIDKKYKE